MTMAWLLDTMGKCVFCGKEASLSPDGLCVDCWDASIPNTPQISQETMIRNLTIKKLIDSGESPRKLAAMFGLRVRTIKKITINMRRNDGTH